MKILVFSDSHGDTSAMERMTELERPAQVLFLGDGLSDARALAQTFPQVPVCCVAGNCDPGGSGVPTERTVILGGHTLFMTHGHRYQVKRDILAATYAAREAGAEVLLYGHTHEAFCRRENGLWILNPGSVRELFHPSYGVILIGENGLECAVSPVS